MGSRRGGTGGTAREARTPGQCEGVVVTGGANSDFMLLSYGL